MEPSYHKAFRAVCTKCTWKSSAYMASSPEHAKISEGWARGWVDDYHGSFCRGQVKIMVTDRPYTDNPEWKEVTQ